MEAEYDPVADNLMGKFFLLVLGLAVIGGILYGATHTSLFSSQAATTTIATTIASQNSSLEDGLVGHWTFDSSDVDWSSTTAEVLDISGSGNHGDINNTTPPIGAIGVLGQAFRFDGLNDYMRSTSLNDAYFPSNGTMAFWIKADFASQSLKSIVDTYDTTRNHIFVRTCATNQCSGVTTQGMQTAFQPSGGGSYVFGNTMTLPNNEWSHITISWDTTNDTAVVYLNGVIRHGPASITNASWTPNQEQFILGSQPLFGNYFNGVLDDVRIYNRALSADEVYRLYTSGKPNEINSARVTNDPLTKGLVGYWKLDEGSGSTAANTIGGSGTNGTLVNSPAWTTGKINSALSFNGSNQYISIPDGSNVLDIDNTVTMSAWVNANSWADAEMKAVFIRFLGYYMTVNPTGNVGVYGYGKTTPGYHWSTKTLSTGAWHHIVTNISATGFKIYIDGMLDKTVSDTGALATWISQSAAIGSNPDSPARLFNGKIDEVRVYNRTLTDDEVFTLYRSTDPTEVDTSLVGHWTFDGPDVSGTTASDRSRKGNNGTLTNGPTKAPGALGQGLALDGSDDYVTVTDNAALDFTSSADFTLSGWFRRETYTTDDTLIAKRNGIANTDDGYIAYIDDTDDKLYFEVSDNADTDEYSLVSTRTFTDNEWHHFMITWDDDNANNTNLFIDGSYETTVKTGTIGNLGDLSNALPFRIGAESDNDNPFAGKLDDIKVYDRALTPAEVYRTYSKGTMHERSCGTVTDADNNLYGTIKIDTQCWMAQNLRVGTRISGATNQTNNSTIEKWCYSNSDANCTSNNPNEPDGGLYQWDEAMQYSTTPGAQGICPAGWHIPTHDELTTLERAICTSGTCATDFPYDTTTTGYRGTTEGSKLKTGGTSGFEFNLAGDGFSGSFGSRGASGYVWSSSESGANAWGRDVLSGNAQVDRSTNAKSSGFSVRCLQD